MEDLDEKGKEKKEHMKDHLISILDLKMTDLTHQDFTKLTFKISKDEEVSLVPGKRFVEHSDYKI